MTRRVAGPIPRDQEQFCVRIYPRLVGALRLYCGSHDLAEEFAQDALVRACVRWRQLETMENPEGWVHKVAINLANSAFRRRGAARRATLRARPVDDGGSLDGDVAVKVDLYRALAKLPPRQRAVVVLRYHAGLPSEEVASLLGISSGAVRMLAQRARDFLAEQLAIAADGSLASEKESPHAR